METNSGVSERIQLDDSYSANGRIALFGVDGDETVTGGSIKNPDGSYYDAYQVLWTITRTPDGAGGYTYTGGVTGLSWYFNEPSSPFYNSTIEAIAAQAFSPGPGNLNTFFSNWIANATSDDKKKFLHAVIDWDNCLVYP